MNLHGKIETLRQLRTFLQTCSDEQLDARIGSVTFDTDIDPGSIDLHVHKQSAGHVVHVVAQYPWA